jgi:hypothetical protein
MRNVLFILFIFSDRILKFSDVLSIYVARNVLRLSEGGDFASNIDAELQFLIENSVPLGYLIAIFAKTMLVVGITFKGYIDNMNNLVLVPFFQIQSFYINFEQCNYLMLY